MQITNNNSVMSAIVLSSDKKVITLKHTKQNLILHKQI